MAKNVMCPLKVAPLKPAVYDFNAPYYLIWQERKSYLEDDRPWKCVAVFMFLPDALDFIAKCQDEGTTVVFQSPASVTSYGPNDRRAVYKPDSADASDAFLAQPSAPAPAGWDHV